MNSLFPDEEPSPQPKPQNLYVRLGKITDREGNFIRPEIGNKQHLNLIAEWAKYKDGVKVKMELEREGEEQYVPVASFKCPCGNFNAWQIGEIPPSQQEFEPEEFAFFFHNEVIECEQCTQKYIFFEDDKEQLKVKFR